MNDMNDFNDEKDCWKNFTTKNIEVKDKKLALEAYKIFEERVAVLNLKSKSVSDEDLVEFYKNIYQEEKSFFRKSTIVDEARCSFWLSQVKCRAEKFVVTKPMCKFQGISKEALKEIAQMSINVNTIKKLPEIMYTKHSIVLVYHQSLPSTKIDGAVFKLTTGHPVIGLSIRYNRMDSFWFTFLHELAHIHLHFDKIDTPILDDLDEKNEEDLIELQADRLAKESLIEKSMWRNCKLKYNSDYKNYKILEKFADEVGVHKAIIAGFLRHEKNNYSIYSDIVNEINIRGIIFEDE